ncbi:MAG: DUF1634 domain-containing protein [Deltaproteobacteria bacterium]|jgi:hypothetical protein|nr:DUF1634 domain-containing protein [Deltaproteobacteria bacterium]
MKGERPKPPLAALVYGEIVYWGVLLGSVIAIIGSTLAFLGDNFVPVSYWLSSVWKGESVAQIWEGTTGSLPMGHWYLPHLTTGDALTALGLSLGVFAVVPALFLSSAILLKEGEKLYGTLALVGGLVVLMGVLGLAPMP